MINELWTGYFVSITRAPFTRILAGPFPRLAQAIEAEPACRALVCEIEPAAARDPIRSGVNIQAEPGALNDRLPAEIRATIGPYVYEPPPPPRIRVREIIPPPVKIRVRPPRPATV